MPNYVMLNQPNKLEWLERAANQSGNFLYQLALSKVAHNWRMEEQDRELENKKIELQAKLKAEQTERERPKTVTPLMMDNKLIGHLDEKGGIHYLPAEKIESKKATTAIENFEYAKSNPEFAAFLEKQQKAGKQEDNFQIEMNPDGTTRITRGTGQPSGIPLSTGGKADVEKKIFDADASLGRIKEIVSSYKPEYQQLGTRWNNLKTSVREKLGLQIGDDDKKALEDFSNYRKGAIANFNKEIKEASGATVTEQEAGRVLKGLPNPGTGLFDGDSPTEFEAALKQSYKLMAKTKARLMWYRAKGVGADEFKGMIKGNKIASLDEMDGIINNRAAQIEKELKLRSPMIDPQTAAVTVRQILKSEFGIE